MMRKQPSPVSPILQAQAPDSVDQQNSVLPDRVFLPNVLSGRSISLKVGYWGKKFE